MQAAGGDRDRLVADARAAMAEEAEVAAREQAAVVAQTDRSAARPRSRSLRCSPTRRIGPRPGMPSPSVRNRHGVPRSPASSRR